MAEDISEFLVGVSRDVNDALEQLVPSSDIVPTRLHEAMRWSLFAGGKRIRPAIVFASGETFGADRSKLTRTAAAIEMIHTFSLIHDDLPAMDDDDLRRGRETCHKKFGEATAILAGDALLALAFQVMADDDGLSCDMRVRLVADIAAASATPTGMVAGQQLDLEAEGREVTLADVENIHIRKTGALISASARAGALIGGASDGDLAAVNEFASLLGLLFQITDDLLDVTRSSEDLGKTAGKDIAAAKATYPAHLGVGETQKLVEKIRAQAIVSLESVDRDTSSLKALTDLIAERTS